MGNTVPIGDERVERCTELLQLTKRDIASFWKIFQTYDREREGTISVDCFFSDICKEKRTLFGDAIWDLIDTEDTDTIEFGEFVQGVCTFAMFEKADVLRFSFFIFDKDKNGYIDKDELELFVATLHTNGVGANIKQALHSVDFNGDGKFDFLEFSALHEKFPTVLYPAFRLQEQMKTQIMTATWWQKKKDVLQYAKDDAKRKIERERSKMQRDLNATRTSRIRAEMGFAAYYKAGAMPNTFLGKKRDYLQRINPMADCYITHDGEVLVRYPEPKNELGDDKFVEKEEQEEREADPSRRAGDV